MQESMKKLSTVKGRMSRDFGVLTKNAEKGWMKMYNGLTRRACRDKIIFNAAQECTRKVASMNFYHLVGIQKLATRYTQLDASQLHNEDGRVSRKLKIINLFVNERQRRRRWGSWRRLTALLLFVLCSQKLLTQAESSPHRLVTPWSESLFSSPYVVDSLVANEREKNRWAIKQFLMRDMKNLCCKQFT